MSEAAESHLKWLVRQYQALWKDYGIQLQEVQEMGDRIATRTESKSPAPSPESLDDIRAWIGDCKRCRLCEGRNHIVFGTGNAKATLMFVGEGPGADEDAQGLPFVGRAGKLLTKIIEAMKLTREEVYIGNVVKCRPPNNRTPLPDEVQQCFPFLKSQIEIIQPKIIVALGIPAATSLLGQTSSMSSVRGKFHKLHWNPKILVMPTYHPAYLLRNPPAKSLVWEDMKLVMAKLQEVK